ncbi:hypothetical protein P9112_007074 [Eukaryota sp. TZLM1-RC]
MVQTRSQKKRRQLVKSLNTIPSLKQPRLSLNVQSAPRQTPQVAAEQSLSEHVDQVKRNPFVVSNNLRGIRCVSSSSKHTLLLTSNGQIYAWGDNAFGQVLFNGPNPVRLPVRLGLPSVACIAAGQTHSLALCVDGSVYGWGKNDSKQLTMSSRRELPLTRIPLNSYSIHRVYAGNRCSFALTNDRKVIYWGNTQKPKPIAELVDVVHFSNRGDRIASINSRSEVFIAELKPFNRQAFSVYKLLMEVTSPYLGFIRKISASSCSLGGSFILVLDRDGLLWEQKKVKSRWSSPVSVRAQETVQSVQASDNYAVLITQSRNLLLWGKSPHIRMFHQQDQITSHSEPIEGVSLGDDYMFAYNQHGIWALGRNRGQLGIESTLEIKTPLRLFGSEICGNAAKPRRIVQPMYSVLIKIVFAKYLEYLEIIFDLAQYVKARFISKTSISCRTTEFARNILHFCKLKQFVINPKNTDLLDSTRLELQLTSPFIGQLTENRLIDELTVFTDDAERDWPLLNCFSAIRRLCLYEHRSYDVSFQRLDCVNFVNLRYLELEYSITELPQLPISLERLVLNCEPAWCDIRYLTSLKELTVHSGILSTRIIRAEVRLPNSIKVLQLTFSEAQNNQISLGQLREMVCIGIIPNNLTEFHFPRLSSLVLSQSLTGRNFTQQILNSLASNDCIEKIVSLQHRYVFKLRSFPWMIQFPKDAHFNRSVPKIIQEIRSHRRNVVSNQKSNGVYSDIQSKQCRINFNL